MSFITLTNRGKCDVTFTFFSEDNSIIAKRSLTYDVKPTIKELKQRYNIEGAVKLRVSTTPSCNIREFKL